MQSARRQFRTGLLSAAAWVLGCSAAFTVNAESVTWISTELAPMTMPVGDRAGEGYIDQIYKFLVETLPQHSLKEEVVPPPRVMFMAQRGGGICTSLLFQTPEREAYLRFTPPYGYLYPIGVVTRGSDQAQFAPYISKAGYFMLDKALQDQRLGLGIAGGRSYGGKIDALVKPQVEAGAKNIQQIYQDESTKVLLAMLERQRFDYMFAFPSEIEYFTGPTNNLRFFPIEGNSDLLPGRFSCTKSPETDKIFADLTRLVQTRKVQPTFMAAYERWLPKYLIKSYRQRLQELQGGTTP
ncbi:TIGR02285 family protein [Curvibacter sp. APW13]|uniref:TIGR02285 family protein n=1 Tax=Curvibacter sp. APW13 TaxID=3077236 RepID=UPI0028DDF3E3|nr:TIGR02285 family protein [Curvibacter sp. APW13]MDT8991797.1 TIGR02285 family protein [Curvibacter sp. APW13]